MHAQVAPDENRLLRSIPAARVALIERITRAISPDGKRSRGTVNLLHRFVKSYFRGVGEEDLSERAPGLLARAALDHFEFGARRAPGQALVRVFNPDPERDGRVLVPSGDDPLEGGDELLFVAAAEVEEQLRDLLLHG